jgi:flagellar biosynthesis/type III secretory pathway M-ring protein FliF/YscJ
MKERFERLGKIWNNLPAGRKFSLVGASLGIIALSVAILAFSGGNTNMRLLVSGADAQDLGEVVDVLKSNNVEFEYGASGDSILVPENQ